MQVPLYNLIEHNRPFLPAFYQALEQVENSGDYILGNWVEAFEKAFAKWAGMKHCIGVGSGTDAILLGLMALGIAPGDEVISTPMYYIHVAGCVHRLGAKTVFVDISRETMLMDERLLEAAITEKTKAVVVPHLFGQMANMPAIKKICDKHGVALVEDVEHGIGAQYAGEKAGQSGLFSAFSFYPTKNLSALGDAGCILTNDDALAVRMSAMRTHGIESGYVVNHVGGNFRLDALHAAMLQVKLEHVDGMVEKRRQLADRYDRHLEEIQVATPLEVEGSKHAYNHYTLRIHSEGRDQLARHLLAQGIECRVYYPRPVHTQPCFAYLGNKEGDFPVAEAACLEVLSIPCFPEMTREQQDYVIKEIRSYFQAE